MRNFVFISVFPFYRIKEILAVYKFYLMTWCHQIVEITFRSLQKLCKNLGKKTAIHFWRKSEVFYNRKLLLIKGIAEVLFLMHTLHFWSKRSQYVVFPQFWQNDLKNFGRSFATFCPFSTVILVQMWHLAALFWNWSYLSFTLIRITSCSHQNKEILGLTIYLRPTKLLLNQYPSKLLNQYSKEFVLLDLFFTAQKIKFSIKDFFRKCDQIRRKLRIWSHFLKKSLIENFIFCVVFWLRAKIIEELTLAISERKVNCVCFLHCVESVQIWSFFWSVVNPSTGK